MKPILIFVAIMTVCGCCENKETPVVKPEIKKDTIRSLGKNTDSVINHILEMIKVNSNYAEAKFKQDSIQILILQQVNPSKRLIKQYYYWDSTRVFWAKRGIELGGKAK